MPDLRRLRTDLAAFALEANRPLEDWQLADLRLEAPISVLLWGRQMGKSRALAVRAVFSAFSGPERRVLVVSGGGELGARRQLGEVRSIVSGSGRLRGSVVDEAASVVRLTNGSEVRCVPASEAAIRGWVVDELHLDESQLLSESLVFGAAMPTVSARPGARVVLAGTGGRADGPFYDLFRRGETGDEHVRSSRRVSRLVGGPDHAPWQQPSMIAAQVAAMSPLRADAEHRCVFASDQDALFTRAALERGTFDFVPSRLADLHGPARYAAGVDWGATTDRSALVAVGRLPAAGNVFAVACAERWPAGARLVGDAREPGVVEHIAASPAPFHVLTAESNGLGFPLTQSLFTKVAERPLEHGGGRRRRFVIVEDNADPFRAPPSRPRPAPTGFATLKIAAHVNATMKAATYSALRLLVERGQLLLPASATELRRELELLRVDLSPSGTERIEASSGHDDLSDALALALGPYQRGREWRTIIGDLAGRGPDAGAAGASVPTFPEWASVAGAEVTAPPSPPAPDPFAAARERVAAALQRTPTERSTCG